MKNPVIKRCATLGCMKDPTLYEQDAQGNTFFFCIDCRYLFSRAAFRLRGKFQPPTLKEKLLQVKNLK